MPPVTINGTDIRHINFNGTTMRRVNINGVKVFPSELQWELGSLPYSKDMRGVAWSPELGLFVAVGHDVVNTSGDGLSWVSRPMPSDGNAWRMQSVTWSPEHGVFVAVGVRESDSSGVLQSDAVGISSDGINWSFQAGVNKLTEWRAVKWIADLGLFVAVSNHAFTGTSGQNTAVMTSPDGINWTERTPPKVPGQTETVPLYDVVWSPALGRLVAVGGSGNFFQNVMTSPDGINWTLHTANADGVHPNMFYGVTWAPALGVFVAVGLWMEGPPSYSARGSSIATSPDGINWTFREVPGVNKWLNDVIWVPEVEKLVAVSAAPEVGDKSMTSSDGINWSIRPTPQAAGYQYVWQRLAWSPALSRIVAVGARLDTGVSRVMHGEF